MLTTQDFRRRIPVLWIAFLATCILCGYFKVRQNEQFRADEAWWRTESKRIEREAKVEWEKTLEVVRGRQYPNYWRLREFEAELNAGIPLVLRPSKKNPDRREASWEHPPGSFWELEFDKQDQLVGHGSSCCADTARLLPPVSRATFEDAGERLRRTIVQRAPPVWCVLLLTYLFAARLRRPLSHFLLAVAIACALAQLVAPNYTLQGMFSNDALFFGAVMLAISLAVLARSEPTLGAFAATHLLPTRFSLRWVLIVVALIAVFVRMGWYGLVIGSVLLSGAVWYVIMSALMGNRLASHEQPPPVSP